MLHGLGPFERSERTSVSDLSTHCGSEITQLARSSKVSAQNARYNNGTTKTGSFVFSVAPYRALQCDRCLVITT
jgi:hypothetical protein